MSLWVDDLALAKNFVNDVQARYINLSTDILGLRPKLECSWGLMHPMDISCSRKIIINFIDSNATYVVRNTVYLL